MALFIIDMGTTEHCRLSTQYDLKLRVMFRYPPKLQRYFGEICSNFHEQRYTNSDLGLKTVLFSHNNIKFFAKRTE